MEALEVLTTYDTIFVIFKKCTISTLLVCSFVNKQFYNIARDMLKNVFRSGIIRYNRKLIQLLYTTKEEQDKFEWELYFEGRLNRKNDNDNDKYDERTIFYNDDIILGRRELQRVR